MRKSFYQCFSDAWDEWIFALVLEVAELHEEFRSTIAELKELWCEVRGKQYNG